VPRGVVDVEEVVSGRDREGVTVSAVAQPRPDRGSAERTAGDHLVRGQGDDPQLTGGEQEHRKLLAGGMERHTVHPASVGGVTDDAGDLARGRVIEPHDGVLHVGHGQLPAIGVEGEVAGVAGVGEPQPLVAGVEVPQRDGLIGAQAELGEVGDRQGPTVRAQRRP
jgi:hypothetical protein